MKLVICGSRTITDYNVLLKAIKASGFTKITHIISGHAEGADMLGEAYAKENGLILRVFKPDWKDLTAEGAVIKENKFGKYNARAGFNRNKDMVDYGDAVLALQSNGDTNGTQDTIKYAKSLDKPVFVYTGEDSEYEYTF